MLSYHFDVEDGTRLYCGGDVHHGIKQDRFDLYQKCLRTCADDEKGLYLGMGDYTEYREPGNKMRDPNNTVLEIQEQVDEVTEAWEVIKDKSVGLLTGNHEAKLCHKIGYDPYLSWCKHAHVPFLDLMSRLVFHMPSGKTYEIVATHGHGGGRKMGGKVNNALDFISNVYADMLAMGHNHQLQQFVHTQLVKGQDGQPMRQYKKVAFCGAFMDGFTEGAVSYAEVGMYSPLPLGYMVITISEKGLTANGVYM